MKSLRNRALALLLAAMLPLSLTACASGSPAATAAPTQAPQSAAPAATDAPAETPETGEPETDQPAAADVGGDLFSLRTSVVYPADGGELIDYAAQEQEENARPELTTHIENLDGYDTIFIGYPNWWADLPMAVYSFFDEYDFSGKTIVPFCTSASDSIDNSLHIFSELCPEAAIAEGLTANDEADIEPWLQGLGLLP